MGQSEDIQLEGEEGQRVEIVHEKEDFSGMESSLEYPAYKRGTALMREAVEEIRPGKEQESREQRDAEESKEGATEEEQMEMEGRRITPGLVVTEIASHKLLHIAAAALLVIALLNSPITRLHTAMSALAGHSQSLWNLLLDRVGEEPSALWLWGTFWAFTGTYWLLGLGFTAMDVSLIPDAARKYKIQLGTNEPVELRKVVKVIQGLLINHVGIGVPFFYVFSKLMDWRGFPPVREMPSLSLIVVSLVAFCLITETGFYYSHRMLHWRVFYRTIHKQHHEWTSPIALAATYCHPVEHLFSNLLPPYLGVFLFGSHVVTAWIMTIYLTGSSVMNHCGYHLPFMQSPEAHDFHHKTSHHNFGNMGILDRIHGTDAFFIRSGFYLRHKMLKSLTPMRQLHPITTRSGKSE